MTYTRSHGEKLAKLAIFGAWISTYSTPKPLYNCLFTFSPYSSLKFKLFAKKSEAEPEQCHWQHPPHTFHLVGTRLLCPHPSPHGFLEKKEALIGGHQFPLLLSCHEKWSSWQIRRKTYPDTAWPTLFLKPVFPQLQNLPGVAWIAEHGSTRTTHSFPSQSG